MAILNAIITFLGRFATQYLTAILLFLPALKQRKHFLLRFIPSLIIYCLLPYAITGFGHWRIYNAPFLKIGWLNLNWIFVFLTGWLFVFFCFDIRIIDGLFYCSAAYAMQHCARKIADIIAVAFDQSGFSRILTIMLVGFVCFTLFYFIFVNRIKKNDELRIANMEIVILSLVTISIVHVLSVYVGVDGEKTKFSGKIYAVVCSVLILICQFGLFTRKKSEYEKFETEKMLHSQEQLYRISMENAELINIKCHDLKKQLRAIRKMPDTEDKTSSLKEIENAVMIFDSVVKTENNTINLIVSEKSLLCEKYGICFSYILDTLPLSFINKLDLYSLLGNALDNAIEEEIKIADPQKRIISLNIAKKGEEVCIHVENYTESTIVFEQGLPVTSKKDKRFHGYGTKSIKYITEKYGGKLIISIEDNIFSLDVLFPLQSK